MVEVYSDCSNCHLPPFEPLTILQDRLIVWCGIYKRFDGSDSLLVVLNLLLVSDDESQRHWRLVLRLIRGDESQRHRRLVLILTGGRGET